MSIKSVFGLGGYEELARFSEHLELHNQLRRCRCLKQASLFLAFFFLSLNLRAPITSLPPVIGNLQDALHISPGMAGFLTSIPVLCFGFLTPLLGWYMKRMSLETSVAVTLLGIILGSLVRSGGSIYAALAGSAIIGASLTMGNIAGLMVLGRDFKNHAGAMTGVYVCGMSIGSSWTTAATAPFAQKVGWQISLAAIPGGLALCGVFLWAAVYYFQSREKQLVRENGACSGNVGFTAAADTQHDKSARRSVMKMPLVWLLSASFAAHTFLFYGLTAWLPLYMEEVCQLSVSQAGAAASLFQIFGILGCMGIPALASSKHFSQMTLFLIVTLSWFATAVGFWLYPAMWIVWTVFGGIGSGGGFTVVFGLVMSHARTLDENRILSTIIQSAGYVVASISPFVIGHIYHLTRAWQASFLLLAGAAVIMTLCGIFASMQRR